MRLPIYQLDSFASHRFAGNPAAVVPLEDWLADDVMTAIAKRTISAKPQSTKRLAREQSCSQPRSAAGSLPTQENIGSVHRMLWASRHMPAIASENGISDKARKSGIAVRA